MDISEKYKNWRYKNTTLLAASLVARFYFADTPFVKNVIMQLGDLGYVGAFITGFFFVSTFTVAPAAIVLYHLADILHPVEIALLAGMGGVVGDFLIFRFLKDSVLEELKPLFLKWEGNHLKALFRTPFFAWFSPFVGAVIIASPLPDEIGISILGISKLKNWQFILLSLVLNSAGIFVIVTLARAF